MPAVDSKSTHWFAIGLPAPFLTIAVTAEVEVPSFLMIWGAAVRVTESTIVWSVTRTPSNGIVCPKGVCVLFSSVKYPVNVRKLMQGIPTDRALGF